MKRTTDLKAKEARAKKVLTAAVMERFRARLPGLIRELTHEVMLEQLERAGLEPECLERARRALLEE